MSQLFPHRPIPISAHHPPPPPPPPSHNPSVPFQSSFQSGPPTVSPSKSHTHHISPPSSSSSCGSSHPLLDCMKLTRRVLPPPMTSSPVPPNPQNSQNPQSPQNLRNTLDPHERPPTNNEKLFNKNSILLKYEQNSNNVNHDPSIHYPSFEPSYTPSHFNNYTNNYFPRPYPTSYEDKVYSHTQSYTPYPLHLPSPHCSPLSSQGPSIPYNPYHSHPSSFSPNNLNNSMQVPPVSDNQVKINNLSSLSPSDSRNHDSHNLNSNPSSGLSIPAILISSNNNANNNLNESVQKNQNKRVKVYHQGNGNGLEPLNENYVDPLSTFIMVDPQEMNNYSNVPHRQSNELDESNCRRSRHRESDARRRKRECSLLNELQAKVDVGRTTIVEALNLINSSSVSISNEIKEESQQPSPCTSNSSPSLSNKELFNNLYNSFYGPNNHNTNMSSRPRVKADLIEMGVKELERLQQTVLLLTNELQAERSKNSRFNKIKSEESGENNTCLTKELKELANAESIKSLASQPCPTSPNSQISNTTV